MSGRSPLVNPHHCLPGFALAGSCNWELQVNVESMLSDLGILTGLSPNHCCPQIFSNVLFFFYLKYFFIYLKGRVKEREGRRMRERIFHVVGSLPHMAAVERAGPGQSQEPEIHPVFHVSCRGLSTWTIFCCFPRLINRELDKKWGSLDINQYAYGIPGSQIVALLAIPQCWLKCPLCSSSGESTGDCLWENQGPLTAIKESWLEGLEDNVALLKNSLLRK